MVTMYSDVSAMYSITGRSLELRNVAGCDSDMGAVLRRWYVLPPLAVGFAVPHKLTDSSRPLFIVHFPDCLPIQSML